jgi:hypothetical protein
MKWLSDLLVATDSAGGALPAGTVLCLIAIWCAADPRDVIAYVERRKPAPVIIVARSQLCASIRQDDESLKRHIRLLRRAGWIVQIDASGGMLSVQIVGAIDRSRTIARGSAALSTQSDSNDLGQSCHEIRAGLPRDPVNPATRSPLRSLHRLTINTPTPRAGALDESEQCAIELLREAIPPAGCARIPATRSGARHLAERLREGWSLDEARALLEAMPAIVARGLRRDAADFYSPEAFDGERLSRWRSAKAKLDTVTGADAPDRNEPAPVVELPETAPSIVESLAALGAQLGGGP